MISSRVRLIQYDVDEYLSCKRCNSKVTSVNDTIVECKKCNSHLIDNVVYSGSRGLKNPSITNELHKENLKCSII